MRLENVLMIGSSGSNVGKTELACTLLRRFGRSHRIVGVKVTPIASGDRSYHPGEPGCGDDPSIEGRYRITEETSHGSGKDTERLLAAGADRVYWLRVLRTHLHQGLTALLEVVGPDAVVICESNALRHVVEPGLFLMVESADQKGVPSSWKPSAQPLRQYADRIVCSDGSRFDLDLERIQLAGARWLLLEDATAIVLAGGRSTRMGTDKSMLPIDGRPMIEHICRQLCGTFSRVLLSANDAERFAFLGLDVIPDRIPDQGPLMAVASALEASDSELNLVVGCDVPRIELPLVRRMLSEAGEADIVLPVTGDGREQPLFAVYRRGVRQCMNAALESGSRRFSDIYGSCRVRHIEIKEADRLVNLNTMADYEQFRSRAKG